MESNGSQDTNKTNVPANGSNSPDLLSFDLKCVRNEFLKLWTVVNFIRSKVEFSAEHCLTSMLVQEINEYKLKCSMHEEKIQNIESERAILPEALRILNIELVTPPTIVHNSHSSADQWQTVSSKTQSEPGGKSIDQKEKER